MAPRSPDELVPDSERNIHEILTVPRDFRAAPARPRTLDARHAPKLRPPTPAAFVNCGDVWQDLRPIAALPPATDELDEPRPWWLAERRRWVFAFFVVCLVVVALASVYGK